jgi:hypothetical protein
MGHFNSFGRYLEKLDRAKKSNPAVAKKYESIEEKLLKKEKYANDTWGVFTENESDYLEKRKYYYEVIKPLNDKLQVLWDQLFEKKVRQ